MIPFKMTQVMNLDLKASKASDQFQKLSTVSFTFVGEDWTGIVNSSVSGEFLFLNILFRVLWNDQDHYNDLCWVMSMLEMPMSASP